MASVTHRTLGRGASAGLGDAPRPARPASQDDIAAQLGGAILGGSVAVGDLLPAMARLQERFGVSRTVIREVFKTLAAKGLIASRPRVGTRVLDVSAWNWLDPDVRAWKLNSGRVAPFRRQLVELRLTLEPAIAGLAARRRSADHLAELRAFIKTSAQAHLSPGPMGHLRSEFRRLIGQAADNPLMVSMLVLVAHEADLRSDLSPGEPRLWEALVTAIAKQNDKAARSASVAIIEHSIASGLKDEIGPDPDLARCF
jgi:DNA-binding FadR family transcriptional regulator